MAKRSSDSDGYGGNSKAKAPRARIDFDSYRICRVELTEADKADLRADYLPGASPLTVLADLGLPGHKFSWSVSDDGHTHIASLTCKVPGDPNAGLTITARGGDLTKAVIVLGYKVLVLCADKPWAQVEHERGGRYDDIG
jgi:hypothetical protein